MTPTRPSASASAAVIDGGVGGAGRRDHGVAAAAGRLICAARTIATFPVAQTLSGAALSDVVGGPVGRHALIGRTRVFTPLRVMFMMALVVLALGWSTKAPCLQTVGTGPPDKRVANWQNQRAYYELCYSDTVPLYGAELLSQGRFPYKSSWIETDSSGRPQTVTTAGPRCATWSIRS